MKKLLTAIALTCLALAASAVTFTYQWKQGPTPKPPHHYPVLQPPYAIFSVPESVVRTGVIRYSDVNGFYSFWSSPFNYRYTYLSMGALACDPLTGQLLSGSFVAIDAGSVYGNRMNFEPNKLYTASPLGGSSSGYWTVTITP